MAEVTDDTLVEYMLGTLESDAAAELGEALASDSSLEHRLSELAAVVAGGVEALPPIDPASDSRGRLLDSLTQTNRFEPFADAVAELLNISRERALEWLAGIDDPSNWSPGALDDTMTWPIPLEGDENKDAAATWLKMPPGSTFPEHEHLGTERVLLLQGRYYDHLGRLHVPGAVLDEATGTQHHFCIGDDGPEFICLAVLENGIRVGDTELRREQIYGV